MTCTKSMSAKTNSLERAFVNQLSSYAQANCFSSMLLQITIKMPLYHKHLNTHIKNHPNNYKKNCAKMSLAKLPHRV